jgi:hypothetical protein
MMAPGGAATADAIGSVTATVEFSRGWDLKKLSSFFD